MTPPSSPLHMHVYYVPRGYTPDQAWEEIQTFGRIRCSRWRLWFGSWVHRVCDSACDGRCT